MDEDPISNFSRQDSKFSVYKDRVTRIMHNRMLGIIVVIIAAALGGGILTFAIGLPSSPCAGIAGTTRNFTIIANIDGFNDSMDHQQGSWPVMTVHRCDTVKVTITNVGAQTHGFAVDYYATRGADISGGQTLSVQPFLATRIGQFRVYCNALCPIHSIMQNGLLIVV